MGRKLNQSPVFVKKENPGYIFNYMLMALIGAAGALRTMDVGSIEDIDRSWMGNFKMEMGPFGVLDTVDLIRHGILLQVNQIRKAKLLQPY